jgi:hypothetical protein
MKFEGVQEFAARVRPTAGMHHLRPADLFLGGIAVALQNAFVPSQEPFRSLASAPELEVKHHTATQRTILLQVGLVMFTPFILHLHSHRRFIGLQIRTAE